MKKLAILFAIIMAFALVAGCSNDAAPQSSAPDAGASDQPSEAPDQSSSSLKDDSNVIIIVTSGPEQEMAAAAAESYMADPANSGRKVTVEALGRDSWQQRLNTTFLAQSPDLDGCISGVAGWGALVAANAVEPLDAYFDKDYSQARGFSKDLFMDSGINLCTYNGSLWGIPFVSNTIMLFYRTDLIDTPPETLDEMTALAEQFTKSINPDSPTTYGLTSCCKQTAYDTMAYIWSFGGDLLAADGSVHLNSPETVDAIEWYASTFASGIMPPDAINMEWANVVSAFGNGECALASQWDSGAGQWTAEEYPVVADKFDSCIRPVATKEDGTPNWVAQTGGWMCGINAASVQKDELFDFYAYMFTPDVFVEHMSSGINTYLKDVLESDVYKGYKDAIHVTEAFNDCLANGRSVPFLHPAYQTVEAELNVAVSNIVSGADVQTELDNLQMVVEEKVAQGE